MPAHSLILRRRCHARVWLAILFLVGTASAAEFEFASSDGIAINDNSNGSPYPSVIHVTGISGTVSAVKVKINGFSHSFPDDADVLLMGPGGQVCAVFSDAGGDGNKAVTNVNLVFNDRADAVIPDETRLASGEYRPANYEPGEQMPLGGIGEIGTNLTALAASGADGDWKLFVRDDSTSDSGSIASWSLVVETGSPSPELILQQPADTTLVNGAGREIGETLIGSHADMSFTLLNNGPTDLVLTGPSSVAVQGPDAGMFTVTSQPTTPVAAYGRMTAFTVRFTPSSKGLKHATLLIANNDDDEGTFLIHLTGVGGQLAILHDFGIGDDGSYPEGPLSFDGNRLYGGCFAGGASSSLLGAIYKINLDGSGHTVIHSFHGGSSDGSRPYDGVIVSGALVYGTTGYGGGGLSGGNFGPGTVFKMNADGSGFKLLHIFKTTGGPTGGLTLVGQNLYGGNRGAGQEGSDMFRLTTAGAGFSLLHHFPESAATDLEGKLIQDGAAFYGVSSRGGINDGGVVFKIHADGSGYQVLHEFGAGSDGANPRGGLTLANATLYGVTTSGGSSSSGTIFKVNTDGSGYQSIFSFNNGLNQGSSPVGELAVVNSTLFGVTSSGGGLYQINTDGSDFHVLHHFGSIPDDGDAPSGGVIFAGGSLFGVTDSGGTENQGTLFKFDLSTYSITATASPAAGGDVIGSGPVNASSPVTVEAQANAGYRFVKWTESGVEVSTSPKYGFTAEATRTLVANFAPLSPQLTVEQPEGVPLISGSGIVNFGDNLTGVATSRVCTLRNTGDAALTLGSLTLAGADHGDFTIDTSGMATTLAPGDSTIFQITFRAAAFSSRAASLNIVSNDPAASPYTLALQGNGIQGSVGIIQFSGSVIRVDQGQNVVMLEAKRTGGTQACSAKLLTANGTAAANPPFSPAVSPADYLSLTGGAATVTFAENEDVAYVPVTLVPQSGSPNKRFTASLLDPQDGASLGATVTATIEILASDATNPTLTITAPTAKVSDLAPYVIKGMAGDAKGIDRVEVSLNGSPAVSATLADAKTPTSVPWFLSIEPEEGNNTLEVTAFDLRGNLTAVTRAFTFSRRYLLTLTRSNPAAGAVSLSATPAANASALSPTAAASDPKTSSIVAGATVRLTATPKAGFVFDQWLGLPMGSSRLGNVVSFTMPANNVAITAQFIATPFNAPVGRPNTFFGLLHDITPPANNGSEGFLTGALTANGGFTGKLFMDGVAQTVNAAFFGDGSSVFTVGAAKQISLTFGGRTLTLAFDFADQSIEATSVKGAVFSSGAATRPLYSSTNKAPVALLSSAKATKGFYTAVFPAKTQAPPVNLTRYPQGDGFATISLTNSGAVSIAGTLADGATITASSALLAGNTAPFLVQLPTSGASAVKGGSFSGTFTFDATLADSDVTATDLLWFRAPAVGTTAATHLYTLGWPDGIRVDAVGALYNTTVKVQTTLGLGAIHATNGNALLEMAAGKLTATISKTNFNINGNTVAKIPTSDASFMLTLAATTGGFSGSFVPNWANPNTSKPAFKGILIQKGASKGGFGFFLSNAKNDSDPESGRVTISAP